MAPPHGTSKAYILDRLRREGRSDFINAIEAGQISALTAAVELGWTHRPPVLGVHTGRAQRRDHALRVIADGGPVLSQMQELWLGPGPCGSLFNSREELQAAWERHRAVVMQRWGSHGRRPAAFYEFEWDGPRPRYAVERSTLWRSGALSAEEKAALEAEWKQEFDAARREGARVRQEHYAASDIPNELIEKWTAQKKRAPAGKRQGPSGSHLQGDKSNSVNHSRGLRQCAHRRRHRHVRSVWTTAKSPPS
jgi:hypothetical protein